MLRVNTIKMLGNDQKLMLTNISIYIHIVLSAPTTEVKLGTSSNSAKSRRDIPKSRKYK